jgi:hypothetical protein
MKLFIDFNDEKRFIPKLKDIEHIDFSLFLDCSPKNKEELSQQIRRCECKIENLITGSANTTNNILRDNNLQSVKDTLNSINTENLILKRQCHVQILIFQMFLCF